MNILNLDNDFLVLENEYKEPKILPITIPYIIVALLFLFLTNLCFINFGGYNYEELTMNMAIASSIYCFVMILIVTSFAMATNEGLKSDYSTVVLNRNKTSYLITPSTKKKFEDCHLVTSKWKSSEQEYWYFTLESNGEFVFKSQETADKSVIDTLVEQISEYWRVQGYDQELTENEVSPNNEIALRSKDKEIKIANENVSPDRQEKIAEDTKIPELPEGYRFIKTIADGGQGKVHLILNVNISRYEVMKVLHSNLDEDYEIFFEEIEALAALDHPNIVDIYYVNREKLYYTMEFVEGESLASKINDDNTSLVCKISMLKQTAQGLSFAHSNGMVHRDLRPENILFNKDDTIKIADFRFAKKAKNTNSKSADLSAIRYMSPEQLTTKQRDYSCDIWALGVILYETLSGKCLFSAQTAIDLESQVLKKIIKPVYDGNENLPNWHYEIEKIAMKALSSDKESRWENMSLIVEELENIVKIASWETLTVYKNDGTNTGLILSQLFENNDLEDLNLEKFTITDVDFSSENLNNTNFRNCVLSKCNFKYAKLRNVSFNNCKLKQCNFEYSELHDTVYDYTIIVNSYFGYSNLQNANLEKATIINSNFDDANIVDTKFPKNVLINNRALNCYQKKRPGCLDKLFHIVGYLFAILFILFLVWPSIAKEILGIDISDPEQFEQFNSGILFFLIFWACYSAIFSTFKMADFFENRTKKIDDTIIFNWKDGDRYIGEHLKGKLTGNGIYISNDGDKYIGEFNNGSKQGVGIQKYKDGSCQVGLWKDDELFELYKKSDNK